VTDVATDLPADGGKPAFVSRSVLVTGGNRGIGLAIAQRLAADGHKVAVTHRGSGAPEGLFGVECDVTEWDQVEALRDAALERFGRIDVVFANAGFGATRGFLEESPEHWRSMVLTNVLGPALTIRATLPHMLERGDGHYLITSSVAGRRPLPGSLYSATKFAATTIGEALRQELRQVKENDRIKVTLIEPGITDTEFFDDKPAEWALRDEDIAREVLHALTAPPGVEINEILIRPTAQRG